MESLHPIRSRPVGITQDCPKSEVLDLGCGEGSAVGELLRFYESAVVGLDIDLINVQKAREKYPKRHFCQSSAENLPFKDRCFSHVDSGVAIPYMDIRQVFSEVYRVLLPGTTFRFSIHTWAFTMREFEHIRAPIPLAYRLYVLLNGAIFSLFGRQFRFPMMNRMESFQTTSRIKKELSRAGFCNIQERIRLPPTFWAKRPQIP